MEKIGSSFKIKGDQLNNVLKLFQSLQSNSKIDYSLKRDIRDCKTIDDFLKEFGWKFKYSKPNSDSISISDVKVILTNLLLASKNNEATQDYIETTLEELLKKFPEEEGVIDISFEGESMWRENELFSTIAPFVEKDSYIEMRGAEGEVWRWVFDGVTFEEKSPEVKW